MTERSRQSPTDWEAAYRDLLPKVFHFFCFRVGDSAVAEDLAAATFEKACRYKEQYKESLGGFSRWLFGIARMEAAGHLRRRRPTQVLDDTVADASDPPEETAQREGEFARLSLLLQELSDRERELLGLKYGAELTNRAISELTGLSESNVGTILHRTVGRLRGRWEEGR